MQIEMRNKLSGAKGLIATLRDWIGRFGTPEELSSDSSLEFIGVPNEVGNK